MASQVLSGSSNPSYTNDTGQNVRVLINYMSNCTSMTWGSGTGVTVTGDSSPVGKEVMTINGELRNIARSTTTTFAAREDLKIAPSIARGYVRGSLLTGESIDVGSIPLLSSSSTLDARTANIFYVPLSITRGGTFPSELVLANGQSFSATCGAYNILVIREDGN